MSWPIVPMKATSAPLPLGDDWRYEPKWDGHRALVRVHPDGRIEAASSTGQPRAETWPWLADLATSIAAADRRRGEWVVDGEVIAMDSTGRHSFGWVGRPDLAHAFVAFDVLVADGDDVRSRPWAERRALLERAVHPGGCVLVTPVTDDAEALLHATRASGYEGIVAKRTGSTYVAGRRPSWVKVKHRREQEVVVGGYLVGNGLRAATFGSLLVGVHEGGHLRFAGGVGTGFDDRTLRSLRARLDVLVRPDPPFEPAPVGLRGRAVWLQPDLVVQVAFAEWTDDGHLRHPVYLGPRDDCPSRSVVREP